MGKKCCISFMILYLCFSCNYSKVKISINEASKLNQDTYSLVSTNEKIFSLDSLTTPNIESISFYSFKGKNELSFLNKISNSLYFYDADSRQLDFIVKLEKTGINGVGKATGHYVHTLDSIFVFDQWHYKVSLINRRGEKLDSFLVPPKNQEKYIFPSPNLATETPMIFSNGNLIMTGVSLGEYTYESNTNRPIIIKYDTKEKTQENFMSYPEVYQNANWGGMNYRFVYSAFSNSKSMILSFPADHSIYKVDVFSKLIEKYYCGSKYFDTIQSFNQDKNSNNKPFANEFFATNPSYSSIIFDKYKNMYYRVVDLPIKQYKEGVREQTVKQFSVIILDSNFHKIGETLIPHLAYSRIAFFVSQDGLNFRKYDQDDDHLTFTTFSPSIIK